MNAIQKPLVELAEQIRAEAFARGFALGIHRMKHSPAVPTGRCSGCGGELAWSGDPEPCGCRPAQCRACATPHAVRCFPCFYAD